MSTRPRILSLFGARVIFGAERANIETLSALREEGCEVLCLVRHEGWNDHVPAALVARGLAYRKLPFIDAWLKGWRVWVLFRNPIAFLVGNWRMCRIVREFRPTHVHAFSPMHVLSFMPALVLLRIPLIYHAGDKPTRHRWVWRALWALIVMRCAHFVAISRFIARELEATKVQADRIDVIYGVPPKRPRSQIAPSVVRRFRNIAFVGQIIEDKGPHLLIRAFRNIAESYADVRILIIGRLSEWRGDDWARALQTCTGEDPALRDKVFFLGFLDDIPGVLQDCELLVTPSLCEEGLGLVVMEAKAAGIPAIVFPSGGLPEMIKHGIDGYICPEKTVQALEYALRFYLDDPSRAQRQGLAARESLGALGVTKFARQLLAVYEATATRTNKLKNAK